MPDKKQEIIDVATRAVKRDGLRSVSFRTLADEVSVKSSSVHYHFPTKHDLAATLVEDYTEGFVQRLRDIDSKNNTVAGKLEAVVDLFADVLAGSDLCLCGMLASEVTSLDKPTRQALRTFFNKTESWLSAIFEASEGVSTSLTSSQAAQVFLSGLEGALLIDRVDDSQERLDAMRAWARSLK